MLNDDQLAGILRNRIGRSNGFLDSKASAERIRVAEYMAGKLPAPIHKGNSKYVSSDVFDSVESMVATLVETFCGAHQTVRFLPTGPEDVEPARIATEVANFAVDRQNNGFQIKQDVIRDGLTGRMGVVKVWWEKDEKESEETFEGSEDDMAAYMDANPDAVPTDATVDGMGQLTAATFTHTTDTSQVKMAAIPLDEFLFSGGARSFEDASLLCHRRTRTVSQLEAMGFDSATVRELPAGTDWLTVERIERADMEDPLSRAEREDEVSGREVELFECYTKIDMDGDKGRKGRKLWQVFIAGNMILGKEEVKRHPFVGFIPLPQAHTIQGDNFAARIIPTQNARTALMRAIIDHATITTNPRYTVLRNGLSDPRELLENRIGGVVNMTKPDAIGVLPQSGLNPFVFQTMQQLDMDREEVTGISKLSQGLNKDALSQQNSGAMVEQLVSMSQVRQKVIARRFGEFLKALYMVVHQLIVENASREFSIEVAGNWVAIDPSSLRNRKDISLDLVLGYGEKEREAQKLVNVDKYLSADPRLAPSYTGKERYTVLSRTLQAMGIKDVGSVLIDPATLPPPQPDPKAQMEMQKLQADIAVQQAQAQATVQKLQLDAQKAAMAHQLDMAQQQLELEKVRGELALKREEFSFRQMIDTAELRLAIETKDNPGTKTLISPQV